MVLAIGSSAGGIEPVLALLEALKPNGRLCVVLAQHVAANRPSLLLDLVKRRTTLYAQWVEQWAVLEADTVFVTPSGFDVLVEDDRLLLRESVRQLTPQPSVDLLFESLVSSGLAAQTVAVVLSGLGSDGARGIAALKQAGALTLAQCPREAASAGMPEAAIATGCVDHTGTIEQLSATVRRWLDETQHPAPEASQTALASVLAAFTAIEPTASRFSHQALEAAARLRKLFLGKSDFAAYARHLAGDHAEANALLLRLLRPISTFDRSDPARSALLKMVASEFLQWSASRPFRVWCVGCAQGHEAYDIALILEELRLQQGLEQDFVIFATDLRPESISLARIGIFKNFELEPLPRTVVEGHFARRIAHMQVSAKIGRKVVFAVHDVLVEGAWPNIDFISCIGILPVLSQASAAILQQRLQMALQPGGRLFTDAGPDLGGVS